MFIRYTHKATAPAGGWRLRVAIMAAIEMLTARAAATLGTSPISGAPTNFQQATPIIELMRLPTTAFHGWAKGCEERFKGWSGAVRVFRGEIHQSVKEST
jgi:hypothetical protein